MTVSGCYPFLAFQKKILILSIDALKPAMYLCTWGFQGLASIFVVLIFTGLNR